MSTDYVATHDPLAVLSIPRAPVQRRDATVYLIAFTDVSLARFDVSQRELVPGRFSPIVKGSYLARSLSNVGQRASLNREVSHQEHPVLPGDMAQAITGLYHDRGVTLVNALTDINDPAKIKEIQDIVLPAEVWGEPEDRHARIALHLEDVMAAYAPDSLEFRVASSCATANEKCQAWKENWLRGVNSEIEGGYGRSHISRKEDMWRRECGVILSKKARLTNALPSDFKPEEDSNKDTAAAIRHFADQLSSFNTPAQSPDIDAIKASIRAEVEEQVARTTLAQMEAFLEKNGISLAALQAANKGVPEGKGQPGKK